LLCLVPIWWRGGFLSWLTAEDDPTIQHFFRFTHLLIVCAACVGGALLLIKPDNIHVNLSRFATSLTCFLVFLHSKHLFLVVAVLVRALALVGPFAGTMAVIALMFGKLCQDLYGPDVDTNERFQDLKQIILTTFQLFTGCGWPGVMWEFTSKTNLGTTTLFCVYMFLSNLLFGQLILGVIISISEQVLGYKSIRFMKPLQHYICDLPEHQAEALLRATYRLGFELAPIHREIYRLTHGGIPIRSMLELSELPVQLADSRSKNEFATRIEQSELGETWLEGRDLTSCHGMFIEQNETSDVVRRAYV